MPCTSWGSRPHDLPSACAAAAPSPGRPAVKPDIRQGDCRELMAAMEPASVDAIVTDPPYGLAFMGKEWDHGVPGEPFWVEALRVAKPGAHLLAFGGTRTYHRLTCAMEDAGWEIRDCLCWLYGSGFPKSLDVSKAVDRAAGQRTKPVGHRRMNDMRGGDYASRSGKGLTSVPTYSSEPVTAAAAALQGMGTALKPAWEPIILARKPLAGPVAANVLAHRTGVLNVDGCRIGTGGGHVFAGLRDGADHSTVSAFGDGLNGKRTEAKDDLGRWPANVVLDEDAAVMLGGASRFFYTAKAASGERHYAGKNAHPTVKPVDLMRWLCRLVTPPGGIVLDPFCGSGSTGIAALAEGFWFIGCELNSEYVAMARRRIAGPLFAEAEP